MFTPSKVTLNNPFIRKWTWRIWKKKCSLFVTMFLFGLFLSISHSVVNVINLSLFSLIGFTPMPSSLSSLLLSAFFYLSLTLALFYKARMRELYGTGQQVSSIKGSINSTSLTHSVVHVCALERAWDLLLWWCAADICPCMCVLNRKRQRKLTGSWRDWDLE